MSTEVIKRYKFSINVIYFYRYPVVFYVQKILMRTFLGIYIRQ